LNTREKSNKFNYFNKRKLAREMALQAVYQWQVSTTPPIDIYRQFEEDNNMAKVDSIYFKSLLMGVTAKTQEIDSFISPLLDRLLNRLDHIERAILRIGCYELMENSDVPYKVVINEGVEIAKIFGAQDSHKYINGILDKLSSKFRLEEIKAFRNSHKHTADA